MNLLTQQRLKELLTYDLETGDFFWIKNRGPVKIGDKAGSKHKDGYLHIFIEGKHYLCHRLAWMYVHGEWPKKCIDHINGNKKDNRIKNLRDVEVSQNMHNQVNPQKHNHSGMLGVSWKKSNNKWVAQISVNKKKKHIGYFDERHDAQQAYLKAKKQLQSGYVAREI